MTTSNNVTIKNFTLNKRNKIYSVKLSNGVVQTFPYSDNYLTALFGAFTYIELIGIKCGFKTSSNPLTLSLAITQGIISRDRNTPVPAENIKSDGTFEIVSKHFDIFMNILEKISSSFKKGDAYYSNKHYASYKHSLIFFINNNSEVNYLTDNNGCDYDEFIFQGTVNGRFVRKFNILQLAVLASKADKISVLTLTNETKTMKEHDLNINNIGSFLTLL